MGRLVAYVVGIALLVAVLCAPALLWDDGSSAAAEEAASEETTITAYVADFDLAEDGDLEVVERLTVDFPVSGKRGIFRFWDRFDENAPYLRRDPRDIVVTRDGSEEPVTLSSEESDRFTVARIGAEDVFLDPGEHVYTIAYRIEDALSPGTTGEASELYWDLVPGGWRQEIVRARLTVHLPVAAPDSVDCAVGAGRTDGCRVRGTGTDTLVVRAGPLPPNTPVTLRTGLDLPTPERDERLWTARWDTVLGPSLPVLVVVLLLGLVAAVVGALLGARSREKDPAFPLMYAPPDGLGPAQAAYLLTEDVDRQAYVATLMHAAEHGAVRLDRGGDTWTITDADGAAGWAGLDRVTTGTAHLLGGPGSSFTASRSDVEAGKRLQTEIADFERSVRGWAIDEDLLRPSGLGGFGRYAVIGGFVAAVAALVLTSGLMTMLGVVPGAFAITGSSMLRTGAGTRRTRAGRELWSRVGGFRRVLSTPSSQQRFEFSGRRELYTKYIPWAVAFDCAEEWAAKYRTEVNEEPPAPAYFAGAYVGSHVGDPVTSMVSDFDSTVGAAISSYTATQTSSSSGGGFSGGGGGGGGGGGSW